MREGLPDLRIANGTDPASLAAMLGDRVETVMSIHVHKTQLGMDRAAATMSQLLRENP